MATRAGVSERTFTEIFPTVEDCYRAAFEEGLRRLSRTVGEAAAREEAWLERVRSGLVALLGFFEDEPSWARLLLLEAPFAGTEALSREQRVLAVVTRLLENGGVRTLGEPAAPSHLTAELLAGGTFAVIRGQALKASGGALVELAPSLMSFIVRPYLGEAAAKAELEGKPTSRCEPASRCERPATEGAQELASEPGSARAAAIARAAELPVRATRRTTLVLRAIEHAPYSNNREVAHAAGLVDEGQTSKLLTRLERQGVIENVGAGAARGEPNAWLLTALGRRAVELLGASSTPSARTRTVRAGGTA